MNIHNFRNLLILLENPPVFLKFHMLDSKLQKGGVSIKTNYNKMNSFLSIFEDVFSFLDEAKDVGGLLVLKMMSSGTSLKRKGKQF